jgi:hypothetical protein
MHFVCNREIPTRSTAVALDHYACLRLSRQFLSGWPLGNRPETGFWVVWFARISNWTINAQTGEVKHYFTCTVIRLIRTLGHAGS